MWNNYRFNVNIYLCEAIEFDLVISGLDSKHTLFFNEEARLTPSVPL
jgi:hypothetical protein